MVGNILFLIRSVNKYRNIYIISYIYIYDSVIITVTTVGTSLVVSIADLQQTSVAHFGSRDSSLDVKIEWESYGNQTWYYQSRYY